MRSQYPTQVLKPTTPFHGLTLEMGIALYERSQGFPTWALVFHPESFSADNVRVYRIVNNSENWVSDFKICALHDLGPLVGVLKVSDRGVRVPSTEILDMFMSSFPPGRDENDSSSESSWTSRSWVMRALEHFETGVKLPSKYRLFGHIRERITVLKVMPPPRPGKLRVIPLDETSSSSQALPPLSPILCTFPKKNQKWKGKLPTRKPIMT